MKTKIFHLKRFIGLLAIVSMLLIAMPSMTAVALDIDAGTKIVDTAGQGFTTYFYRLPYDYYGNDLDAYDGSTYTYGYGYGYSGGTYSYGYGYGYGYGDFADNAASWFTSNSSRMGYFMGTSTGTNASAQFPVASGVATVPVATTLGGTSVGVTGAALSIPASTTITGTGWDGTMNVSASSSFASIPTAVSSSFGTGAATFVIDTGGIDLTFDPAILLAIPVTSFSSGIVRFIDSSSTVSSISACSFTPTTPSDPASYSSLTAGQACYYHDSANSIVYVGTTHASTFVAGPAASTSSTTTTIGGSLTTGGSSKKKQSDTEADEEEENGDKDRQGVDDAVGNEISGTVKIKDLTDVKDLLHDDWRYPVVAAILDSGLMTGETAVDGSKYFNMEGGMNRAMAATVVARYVGCDLKSAPDADPFVDVPAGEWYGSAVACLKENGIVSGKTPTVFDPVSNVTRVEFGKMMVEGYLMKHPTLETSWRVLMSQVPTEFGDVTSSHWGAGYINVLAENGLLQGYDIGDGKREARPDKTIIRIEAAAIVTNFIEKSEKVAVGDPTGY